ncbi:hypothetical protein F5X99DRAFT_364185, partial [Biscogniauxia marginata]
MFYSDIPNGTYPELLSVDGGEGATTNLRQAGSESNLDFQMAYGLIWPQEPALFQVDDEWYQQAQQSSPLVYTGFFNSKRRQTPSLFFFFSHGVQSSPPPNQPEQT